MRINLLAFAANIFVLLIALFSRATPLAGGIGELMAGLPWASFGTELGDLMRRSEVSSAALIAGWLTMTLAWALLTLISWALGRRRSLEQMPSSYPSVAAGSASAASESTPTPAADEPSERPQDPPQASELAADLEALSARLPPGMQGELIRLQRALDQLAKS